MTVTRHQITNDNQRHNRWHLSTQFSIHLQSNIQHPCSRQEFRLLLILTSSGQPASGLLVTTYIILLDLHVKSEIYNSDLISFQRESIWRLDLVYGEVPVVWNTRQSLPSVMSSPVPISCHQLSLEVIKDSCVLSSLLMGLAQNDSLIWKPFRLVSYLCITVSSVRGKTTR